MEESVRTADGALGARMRFEVTISMPGEEPLRQVVEFRSVFGVEHFVAQQQRRVGKLGGEVTWRDARDAEEAR